MSFATVLLDWTMLVVTFLCYTAFVIALYAAGDWRITTDWRRATISLELKSSDLIMVLGIWVALAAMVVILFFWS